MKKVKQVDMVKFIKEQIIHSFEILELITTDQSTISLAIR